MRLELSQRFRDDLRQSCLFIRQENPRAARMVRDHVLKAIKLLKQFPESGRSWRSPGTWELMIPGLPYFVVYEIREDYVVILKLFHTSRDLSDQVH